jgi:uncharacterized membrane protein
MINKSVFVIKKDLAMQKSFEICVLKLLFSLSQKYRRKIAIKMNYDRKSDTT